MIASSRIAATSSTVISGSGFAIAKMIGSRAIERIMASVNAPLAERPNTASAPASASASVRASVRTAWADFHWFMPSYRPSYTTPLVSHRMTFSGLSPSALRRSRHAMPAAPAPLTTSFVSRMSRPVRCIALTRPAAAMIAVPCWSSWNTGMSINSRSRSSMMKHSGALISSRLMPPKVGPR